MSKKHLTLSDRIIIQTGLQQHLSLAKIAEKAGVSRSTVSREIKARRRLVKTSGGNLYPTEYLYTSSWLQKHLFPWKTPMPECLRRLQ